MPGSDRVGAGRECEGVGCVRARGGTFAHAVAAARRGASIHVCARDRIRTIGDIDGYRDWGGQCAVVVIARRICRRGNINGC